MFEKVKEYVHEKVEKGKEAIKGAAQWVSENKEITAMIVIGGYRLGKQGLHYLEMKESKTRRDTMFYDDKTRKWERSRRKLRRWEYDELIERKARGEYVHNILKDMDLLK